MEVKTTQSGDFAEGMFDTIGSNVLSDAYYLFNKSPNSLTSLAYDVRDNIKGDEPDVLKWAKFLSDVKLTEAGERDDGSLGAAFRYSTDYSANDYADYTGKLQSFPTTTLREAYPDQKDWLVAADVVNEEQTVVLPVIEGEAIPVMVTTDKYTEATHTFERAKKLVEDFVEHNFEIVATSKSNSSGSNSDETQSEDNDSDERELTKQEWIADPTTVSGIGDSTMEKLRAGGFEAVAQEEREEMWREMQAEQDDSEGPGKDLWERYCDMKEQMDEEDAELVRDICASDSGNTQLAHDVLVEYETEAEWFDN
jgi:hypothetical protein